MNKRCFWFSSRFEGGTQNWPGQFSGESPFWVLKLGLMKYRRGIAKIGTKKSKTHGCFQKLGVPQNGWFIMEIPIEMDDLGGKPTIFGNTHI